MAGTWILNWNQGLPANYTGLDLGCGKLRYTFPMSRRLRAVTAVDSEVQVSREQTLFGVRSSVRQYAAEHLPNVHVNSLLEADWRLEQYDAILCSNVLSAIPIQAVRKDLLATALSLLSPAGTFLMTTQYKNSHFSAWNHCPRAAAYRDGFLVETRFGTSFYALLDCKALTTMCRSVGFLVGEAGHAKELAYVIARRSSRPS